MRCVNIISRTRGKKGIGSFINAFGMREGIETVQLYVRRRDASVSQPVKVLKGIKCATLSPEQRMTVRFSLSISELCRLAGRVIGI